MMRGGERSGGRGGGRAEVSEEVRKEVRSVLLSSPKGVQLKKFRSDYRSLCKEDFPWSRLGYSSVVDLLKAMPDVVRFEFSTKHDDYCLYGIADRNCYLPSWVQKAQGKNSNIASTPPPPSCQVARTKNTISLPTRKQQQQQQQQQSPPRKHSPSKSKTKTKTQRQWSKNKHLVTVHVSFRHQENLNHDDTVETLTLFKKRLPEVMKVAGNPKDIYIDGKGFAFVRYATLREAKRAIELCSGKTVGKTRLIVTQARESEELFSNSLKKDGGDGGDGTGRSEGAVRGEGWQRGGEKTSGAAGEAGFAACRRSMNGGDMQGGKEWQPSLSHSAGWEGGVRDVDSVSVGSQSDVDSDFWDEELLTSSPFSIDSNTGQVSIPYRAVSVPPLRIDSESQHVELSPRNTPNESGLTPVHVSLVESPSLVWLLLTSDPKGDVTKLSEWIAHLCPPRLRKVSVGEFCCMRMVSGGYWRVRVDQFDDCFTQQQATVLFVDTGKSQMVSCQHLCSLPPSLSLTSVPPLAMPCRLHGVHSTFSAGEWYFLDNQLLWKHLMKKKVYVRKIDCPGTCSSAATGGLPQVMVDIYLDAAGRESVAELLVMTGMHVAWEEGASVSGGRQRATGSKHVCSVGAEGDRGRRTRLQMISKTVRITEAGESKRPSSSLAHVAGNSQPRSEESTSGFGVGCLVSALQRMEEGQASRAPVYSPPPLFSTFPVTPSPPPVLTTSLSPPPISPSSHSPLETHSSLTPSVNSKAPPYTHSPFLRLQKVLHTLETDPSH